MPAVVDSLTNLLTEKGAADRDHQAWPRWGEVLYNNFFLANSYDEEIAYVKDYIVGRIAWLDEQLGFNPNAVLAHHQQPSTPQSIYSLNGIRTEELHHGLNIVRYNDGTVRKIWRK